MTSTLHQARRSAGRTCSTMTMDERSRWLGIVACGALAGWGMKSGAILQTIAGAAGGFLLATAGRNLRSSEQKPGAAESAGGSSSDPLGASSPGQAASPHQQRFQEWTPPVGMTDPVDEASMDSFPCSDPPSFTGESATPSAAFRQSLTALPEQKSSPDLPPPPSPAADVPAENPGVRTSE